MASRANFIRRRSIGRQEGNTERQNEKAFHRIYLMYVCIYFYHPVFFVGEHTQNPNTFFIV